jgi:hypothetical protein
MLERIFHCSTAKPEQKVEDHVVEEWHYCALISEPRANMYSSRIFEVTGSFQSRHKHT